MLYRQFTSQDQIDAEYNVELSIADGPRWFDFFINESARARADLTCHLDESFGPTRPETMDIFPAPQPDGPIVVFIHGGYWRRLSAKEFSFAARGLVARGMTAVITNYALCPQVTIAEITRQSRAAVAWIYRNAARFNGSAERIFVAGHSAGGHQVARLLATDWATDYGLPANLLKGGYALSGLFDLRPLRYSWLQPMLQLDGDMVRRESPQFHIPDSSAPLVADVGGLESAEFQRQSQEFIAAWNGAGLNGRYTEQQDCHHFSVIEGFNDGDSLLCERLSAFVTECESRQPEL